jgi:5'-methylthioadenosine phosphorylase
MCYALVALVSDYDCWRPHKEQENRQTLLAEIMANLQTATNNCLELIKAVLTSGRELVCEDCRCRNSLNLAVWTDQGRIEPAEKEKLKVLFE